MKKSYAIELDDQQIELMKLLYGDILTDAWIREILQGIIDNYLLRRGMK